MIRTVTIIVALIAIFALYKMQHVRPIDDPRDSPIFSQRLQSSLDRFQEGELSPEKKQDKRKTRPGIPSSPRPSDRTKELVAAG